MLRDDDYLVGCFDGQGNLDVPASSHDPMFASVDDAGLYLYTYVRRG